MIADSKGLTRPDAGYGDTGGAARFFYQSHWMREELFEDPIFYCAKASRSERDAGLSEKCSHPTVKPISLTSYLATLLLPPPSYSPRRLLIPFAGVASEMIGAYRAGWEDIIGIELMEEYIKLGQARLDYWMSQPDQLGFDI